MELNRNGGKKDEYMDKEIYKDLIKEALKHECRLSDRQIRLLEWQHIGECSVRTRTQAKRINRVIALINR